MSLVRRPNSRYWYVQIQIDKKTFTRSTKTADRKAALIIAEKIRTSLQLEVQTGPKKKITLREALERFVASKAGTPNHRNLVSNARTITASIGTKLLLDELTTGMIEDFVQGKTREGLKPQTVKHLLNSLVGAVKKATKDGYRCAVIEPPSIKVANSALRYLSIEEEKRLLAELNPNQKRNGMPDTDDAGERAQDNCDLVVILLDTGARYSEIANMRWSQVNLVERSIDLWRPKVGNQSILFMTDRVFEIMHRRSRSKKSEFVFTNKRGGARGYSVIAIRKAFRRAKLLDCSIHTLRHTHASRLIQNGLNLYEVKSVLGHTDIKTTLRYAHLEQVAVTQKARDVINRLSG